MPKQTLIFAHRGASSIAPENTMAAFRVAKKVKADGIELDVQLTADNQLVVIHDYDINRTANVESEKPIPVKSLTLAELQKYDFGAGEKILTLKQAMDFIGPDMWINIEIKADQTHPYKEVSTALADFLAEYSKDNSIDKVFVSSFHPSALNTFRRTMRIHGINIPTSLLYGTHKDVPKYMQRGQGRLIHSPNMLQILDVDLLNRKNLSGGKPIIAWTVDDATVAKKLIDKKIFGIVTNVPEKIIPLIK